jgi:branched-chain amino acid transport system substrate-binding protein
MNNALFKDQLDAGVPSLFPFSAARSMFLPFHRLKFYGAASYVDQVAMARRGVGRPRASEGASRPLPCR